MFFILFTIEIIWAITILVSYGILSLVGIVHITFSPTGTGIVLLPPPTIFTISMIHNYFSFSYCSQAGSVTLILRNPICVLPFFNSQTCVTLGENSFIHLCLCLQVLQVSIPIEILWACPFGVFITIADQTMLDLFSVESFQE